jgi:hypothetical protein
LTKKIAHRARIETTSTKCEGGNNRIHSSSRNRGEEWTASGLSLLSERGTNVRGYSHQINDRSFKI